MAKLLALVGLLLVGGRTADAQPDSVYVFQTSFGSFEQATRITVGPDGTIFVVDARRNAVLIYKSAQDSAFVLGGFGWSSVTFDRPTGVATDGLNIYISDYGNHRIQRYDRYSNLLSTLYTRDTTYAPAQFGYPTGVALTNQGDLIILDSENLRVVEFSADSRFERNFGDLTTAGGKLQDPVKVCVEGDRLIYVLEKHKALEFDFYGNYMRSFATDLPDEIMGGQSTPVGVSLVTSDTLYSFAADGAPLFKMSFSTLIADAPIAGVQDIAFYEDNLFVLTPHRCFIFKIEQANH